MSKREGDMEGECGVLELALERIQQTINSVILLHFTVHKIMQKKRSFLCYGSQDIDSTSQSISSTILFMLSIFNLNEHGR